MVCDKEWLPNAGNGTGLSYLGNSACTKTNSGGVGLVCSYTHLFKPFLVAGLNVDRIVLFNLNKKPLNLLSLFRCHG